jgi:hypothetical protein
MIAFESRRIPCIETIRQVALLKMQDAQWCHCISACVSFKLHASLSCATGISDCTSSSKVSSKTACVQTKLFAAAASLSCAPAAQFGMTQAVVGCDRRYTFQPKTAPENAVPRYTAVAKRGSTHKTLPDQLRGLSILREAQVYYSNLIRASPGTALQKCRTL